MFGAQWERVTSDDSNGDLMKQFHTGTYDFSLAFALPALKDALG